MGEGRLLERYRDEIVQMHRRERSTEPPKRFTYQRINPQEHAPMPLPSVKELSDTLK